MTSKNNFKNLGPVLTLTIMLIMSSVTGIGTASNNEWIEVDFMNEVPNNPYHHYDYTDDVNINLTMHELWEGGEYYMNYTLSHMDSAGGWIDVYLSPEHFFYGMDENMGGPVSFYITNGSQNAFEYEFYTGCWNIDVRLFNDTYQLITAHWGEMFTIGDNDSCDYEYQSEGVYAYAWFDTIDHGVDFNNVIIEARGLDDSTNYVAEIIVQNLSGEEIMNTSRNFNSHNSNAHIMFQGTYNPGDLLTSCPQPSGHYHCFNENGDYPISVQIKNADNETLITEFDDYLSVYFDYGSGEHWVAFQGPQMWAGTTDNYYIVGEEIEGWVETTNLDEESTYFGSVILWGMNTDGNESIWGNQYPTGPWPDLSDFENLWMISGSNNSDHHTIGISGGDDGQTLAEGCYNLNALLWLDTDGDGVYNSDQSQYGQTHIAGNHFHTSWFIIDDPTTATPNCQEMNEWWNTSWLEIWPDDYQYNVQSGNSLDINFKAGNLNDSITYRIAWSVNNESTGLKVVAGNKTIHTNHNEIINTLKEDLYLSNGCYVIEAELFNNDNGESLDWTNFTFCLSGTPPITTTGYEMIVIWPSGQNYTIDVGTPLEVLYEVDYLASEGQYEIVWTISNTTLPVAWDWGTLQIDPTSSTIGFADYLITNTNNISYLPEDCYQVWAGLYGYDGTELVSDEFEFCVEDPLLTDSDEDSVPDIDDQCPDTPAGTAVDSVGCPEPPSDIDGDGIPNCCDLCPGTPAGTAVNSTGCPELPDTGNETGGNETGGNETGGNETGGNETGGNDGFESEEPSEGQIPGFTAITLSISILMALAFRARSGKE